MPLFYQTRLGHSTGDRIRLLHLHPCSDKKAIVQAGLEVVSFASPTAGAYEALSYVWGKESIKDAIQVGDVKIDATRNLIDALQQLRLADRTRVLWVDAVCINQQDDAEKSHQVAFMGSIYRHAARVVAWLGAA